MLCVYLLCLVALIAAVNQQKELVETSRYFNSSADKRKAYNQASKWHIEPCQAS